MTLLRSLVFGVRFGVGVAALGLVGCGSSGDGALGGDLGSGSGATPGEGGDQDAGEETTLGSPASAPTPESNSPGAAGVSFARDGDERIYGVRIENQPHTNPKVVYSV